MEWGADNKYNSFNSYKGLAYYEHYKRIVKWLANSISFINPTSPLPPPVECSLDPIAKCNLRCYYCNSQRYLYNGEIESGKVMSYQYMYDLMRFLIRWGVKGLCFGGGGESLLNKDTWRLYNQASLYGIQPAVVTNGTIMNDNVLCGIIQCRWIGISLDAATSETYRKIKGVDLFDKVIENIKTLVDNNRRFKGRADIAIKYLILPENVDEIYDACLLAKQLGVRDFHVRPVDLERKDYKNRSQYNFDTDKIRSLFDKCHSEETDKFHIYTVTHKYDDAFHVKHEFNKCLASPLVLQCCTDGNCYVCVDHRMEPRFRLGSQANITKWWGSKEHRELVQSIDPHKECSRCTWSEYNRQIEEVVLQDRMCLSFP